MRDSEGIRQQSAQELRDYADCTVFFVMHGFFSSRQGGHQIPGARHSTHQRSGLAESLATRLIAPPYCTGRGLPPEFGGPGQHMGRICPLFASRLQQPMLFKPRQHGIEKEEFDMAFYQTGMKLIQYRVVKSWIVEVHT